MSGLVQSPGSGPGGSYVDGDHFGYQSAENLRNDLHGITALRSAQPLVIGGAKSSRHFPSGISVPFDHPNGWEVIVDWTYRSAGWSVVARYQYILDVASSALLTVRIRNITDAVDYDSTPYSYSAAYAEDSIAIPVPAVLGLKRYKLQLVIDSVNIGVNAVGVLETYG